MFRGVLGWLVARVGSSGEEADEETGDTRFIPSPLDASVRFTHGGSGADIEREIANIETKARVLEEQRHER